MEKEIEYKMVDLGLPSGLKWADRNVGAENPESIGDYFMLGSTEPDTEKYCDWAHAPFNGGNEDYDEAYFNGQKSEWLTDEGVLKPEYDAAHVIMGCGWRMPTNAEVWELIKNTEHEFASLEGSKGLYFISKSDKTKKIFFPFNACRTGLSYCVGRGCGFVRASSMYDDDGRYSENLFFDDNGCISGYLDEWCCGFAVRGVHE